MISQKSVVLMLSFVKLRHSGLFFRKTYVIPHDNKCHALLSLLSLYYLKAKSACSPNQENESWCPLIYTLFRKTWYLFLRRFNEIFKLQYMSANIRLIFEAWYVSFLRCSRNNLWETLHQQSHPLSHKHHLTTYRSYLLLHYSHLSIVT